MRKHTRCCSLQTSTANPYSRGTSPQTAPNSSTRGTRPLWLNFPTNSRVHAHWFLGSRSQTNLTILNKGHNTEQIKTRIHTCAHTPKCKAWVTHVMLARSNLEVLIRPSNSDVSAQLWKRFRGRTVVLKVYYCVVCVLCVRVCEIQTRLAQHMSCSRRQVLHLWRAHSPPSPSLMRKVFKAPKAFAPVGLTARHWVNTSRATRREIWCYPARH